VIVQRIAERAVRQVFAGCDVEIGGRRPWDIRVRDSAFYRRMAVNPAFELGETYLDRHWECDAVDELVFRLLTSRAVRHTRGWKHHLRNTLARFGNPQSRARASHVAIRHYNRTPLLFRRMLDEETMSYTCGYWQTGDALGSAQRAKLRKICDKLALRDGETLLDIGCGFGGLAAFAAEEYGARVLGITNSQMHCRVAQERCAGLPSVDIALLDYRDLPTLGRRFDKVASIEMIEAVGPKNFAAYMQIVHRAVRPGGRFVVQAFVSDTSQHVCNEWFDRYIFPNGVSPSLAQLRAATAGNFAAPKQIEEMGEHYPPTLLAWHARLSQHWAELQADERARRVWHFYLMSLAGVFRARDLRLCQISYASAG
jgi:cyclopropane-fatty-acyl-phospholipid synthase